MNDITWNKIAVTEFKSLACLTQEEEMILQDWAAGKSTANTSMRRNMSIRQVDRIRKQIRKKYDAVQIYTPLLPPRERKK